MKTKTWPRIACMAALTALPATAGVADENFQVTVVAGQPVVQRFVRMIPEVFVPEVDKRLDGSGYTMSFTEQFGGSIANSGEELEAVGSGLAEFGTCISLFEPNKLALQNIGFFTPFVTTDVGIVSRIMGDLQFSDANMRKSFEDNDTVYIGAPVIVDDYVLMTNFPVTKMEDLQGIKLGLPAAAMNWLSGTGAVGVSGSLATYYNELKTGVYDGVLVFASAAWPAKLHEVAPYITTVGLGAQFAGGLCANKDWYDGLPDEVKAAMNEAASVTQSWYVDDLQAAAAGALTSMAEDGATVTTAPDEMRQAWAAGLDNTAKVWADALDAQGRAGTETLDAYMQAMRGAGATPLRQWDQE